jgi:acyl-CoA dehydrogenase
MTGPIERAKAIADTVAARHASAVDADARFPSEAFASLKDARLLGAFVPKHLGGDGVSVSVIASICYQLGQACGSTGLIFAMHQIQTACIVMHGQTIDWHADWLRAVAAEQLLLASATTEAATGGDLGQSQCAIVADGDRFTVEKLGSVISYGSHADGILVTARRAANAPSSDQVLAVVPRRDFTLEETAQWDALGMRGTCSNTFAFRASGRIEQILPSPYGEIHANTMAPFSHLTWSSVWLGIATDALARARRFLRANSAKSGQLAPAFARLVDATAALQRMKADLMSALQAYEEAIASGSPATLNFTATINNLKVSAAQTVVDIVQQAMMICGISGYRNDSAFSVARHLRDAHSAALMVNNDRIVAGMGKMLLLQRDATNLLPSGHCDE